MHTNLIYRHCLLLLINLYFVECCRLYESDKNISIFCKNCIQYTFNGNCRDASRWKVEKKECVWGVGIVFRLNRLFDWTAKKRHEVKAAPPPLSTGTFSSSWVFFLGPSTVSPPQYNRRAKDQRPNSGVGLLQGSGARQRPASSACFRDHWWNCNQIMEWDHISLSGAVTGKTSVKGTDVRSFKPPIITSFS